MRTIFKIIITIFVFYLLWALFLKPANNTQKNNIVKKETTKNVTIIKGVVTSNYSLLDYSVVTVKELSSGKIYHILLTHGDTPSIGSPVIIKIKKYTLIKINDKSITLYKQVDT